LGLLAAALATLFGLLTGLLAAYALSRFDFPDKRILADRGRHAGVNCQTRKGNIPFEISIPGHVFRNLNLAPEIEARAALRDESFWVMDGWKQIAAHALLGRINFVDLWRKSQTAR
jgi:hypothetical protein